MIPKDAIEKDIKNIAVTVKAKVGLSFAESKLSDTITVSKESTDTLTTEIETLLVNDNKYNVSSLEAFSAKVAELEKTINLYQQQLKECVQLRCLKASAC